MKKINNVNVSNKYLVYEETLILGYPEELAPIYKSLKRHKYWVPFEGIPKMKEYNVYGMTIYKDEVFWHGREVTARLMLELLEGS